MFLSIAENVKALRSPVFALLAVYWIYTLSAGMVDIFTQLYLYQKFASVSLNIIAALFSYTGIMIGFTVPGIVAAKLRLNLKYGFMWSFIALGSSLFYLAFTTTISHTFLALFLLGFGQGIFYLTINSFELIETVDAERDFYSSALNAGNQIIGIVAPALAASLIWLSGTVLHLGSYTLLFSTASIFFLCGVFFISKLRTYRPQPIVWADIHHYIADPRNMRAQLYTLGNGFQQILGTIIPPLIILSVLGTPLHIGVYNTVFALLSTLCVLLVAPYRTQRNRLFVFGVTTLGIAISIAWLGYAQSLMALLLYTTIKAILSPLRNVSVHVIDLSTMEIGRTESDFYATAILRDFSLWVWRVLSGLLLLALIHFTPSEHMSLSIGMYLLSFWLLVTYAGAALFLRYRAVY